MQVSMKYLLSYQEASIENSQDMHPRRGSRLKSLFEHVAQIVLPKESVGCIEMQHSFRLSKPP